MNEEILTAPSRSAVASRFFNNLHRYKNVLISKWWVLLLCVGASLGSLAALKWHAQQKFESLGRMIVGTKASLPNGGSYTEEANNFYGTQIALMQSDSVSNRATLVVMAQHPDFHSCPIKLKAAPSPKTSIFNLSAEGEDPRYTQAFLQAAMEQYIKLKQEMRGKTADSTKEAVQAEITRLSGEILRGKQALVDYQSSNSVVFLQDQGNSAAGRLAELTHQQANLKSELQLLKMLTLDENVERQLSLAQQNMSKTPSVTPSAQEMKQDGAQVGLANDSTRNADQPGASVGLVGSQTEYLKAKQQIMLLQAQRAELSEFLRPKHPKIVALDEEIVRKEKLLDLFRNQSQEQLVNLQHSLELQIQNLDADIKVWEVKSLDISKKMAEYQTIKEDNQRLQNMYDRLVTMDFSIDTDKSMAQESVTILEEATPARTVPPQTAKWAMVALILGLGLGVSILLVVDHLDDRPTSLIELQEIVEDEEVLGQIPRVHSKDKSPGILTEDDDRHAMVEAYRNLRSSVLFSGTNEKRIRTLVVTSAIPGDGKSMTSANLAITLARAGSKVLLIDGDLRRGVMHTRFGLKNNTPGFSEILLGKCKWTEALMPSGTPNLTLIPRGSTNRHPGELFVTPAKDQLIKDAMAQFDLVLFDTAPVMAADDVSNLAPHVDGVVMVIRANYTSGRVARAALDLLNQRKARLLGVVFNAVHTRSSEYYYYHYKDYYAKTPTA